MRAFLTFFVGAVAALSLSPQARADDTTPPVITYAAPAPGTQPKGAFTVDAKITDESKFFPQVFFRYGAGPFEKPIDMKKKPGARDTYEATIPYKGDNIEFYIEAYDEFGNGPARAGDPDNPIKYTLGEAAPPPPPPPAPVVRAAPPPAPAPATVAPAPRAPMKTSGNSGTVATSSGGGGRTWTWIVGGVGLGVLAGGLITGLAVKTEDDAYKQALAGTQNANGTTQVNNPSALAAQHDANVSLGTKATVLTITGAVLLAGGVALFFIESPSSDSGSSGSSPNRTNNNYRSTPGTTAPAKPAHNPADDGPGFNGENDAAPAAPLPAISSLSFGAAPVQGGGAVALAGHF